MKTMQQCQLKQSDGAMLVAWIDSDSAVVGKRFTLKVDGPDDTKRTPVMEVIRTWKTKRSTSEVKERGHDYTRTRKASDI